MMKIVDICKIPPIWGGSPICAMESDVFYVAIFQDEGAVRLDVVRKNMKDGITWDELQQLKNDCGYSEQDGVEFYPRAKDLFNTGNVRHLFVFNEKLPLIRRNGHA